MSLSARRQLQAEYVLACIGTGIAQYGHAQYAQRMTKEMVDGYLADGEAWVARTLAEFKALPGQPYGTDDEQICQVVIKRIQAKQAGRIQHLWETPPAEEIL